MSDNTSRSSQGQPISMQGSLDKQCKMRTWTWKNYWFVLKDNHLTYYKEGSRRSTVLIDLAQAHCVRNTSKADKGFAFEVVTKSRTHVLSSQTEETRTKWVDKLRRAMMCKRSSSSISSSSISSTSSMNKQHSFSTPSCNSISDDDDTMTYENPRESSPSVSEEQDDVFISSSITKQSSKNLNKSPPKIPMASDPPPTPPPPLETDMEDDPLYSTPFDACTPDEPLPDSAKSIQKVPGRDYEYISNGFEEDQDPDNPYSEVQVREHVQPKTSQVVMRKSNPNVKTAVCRLVGSKPTDSTASVVTEPAYSEVSKACRTPSDYKTPALVLPPIDSSGESDVSSDRLSALTLVVEQADDADVIGNDLQYDPVPDLPHPRLEMTFGGAFDDIRRFIAKNRGPEEMYTMANKMANNGKAIKKLKEFLTKLENKSPV